MITFVGVGPGDPELVTLGAVRALQQADVIALADSGLESVTGRIVAKWISDKKIINVDMPMKGAVDDWRAAHNAAAQQLLSVLRQGLSIAYPVLGDPSLYASSAYLVELISPYHPCNIIPGVPAICAAAAKLNVPLALGRETLTILPGLPQDAELPDGNVMIMKADRDITRIALAANDREAYLARNLGMPDEYAGRLSEAPQGKSYFTTVIIKPSGKV